jgi:hypothetical protein
MREGAHDLEHGGRDPVGDDDTVGAGRADGHVHRLGRRRRAVVERGVRDVEAGDLADDRLVLEESLQDALAHLGLVGGVAGVDLAAETGSPGRSRGRSGRRPLPRRSSRGCRLADRAEPASADQIVGGVRGELHRRGLLVCEACVGRHRQVKAMTGRAQRSGPGPARDAADESSDRARKRPAPRRGRQEPVAVPAAGGATVSRLRHGGLGPLRRAAAVTSALELGVRPGRRRSRRPPGLALDEVDDLPLVVQRVHGRGRPTAA